MTTTILRSLAIAIVLFAIADPAIRRDQSVKPVVSVVAPDSAADGKLAEQVAAEISRSFTVVRAPLATAAASIVVGTRLPPTTRLRLMNGPAFAVLPDRSGTSATIQTLHAPSRASIHARVPIRVATRVTGAQGRKLLVTLQWNGVVVDRAERNVASDDELLESALTFVPSAAGTEILRVEAGIVGEKDRVGSDLALDVTDRRWAVLFFDRRPTWMSTFVRRALESDPRFVVTSRIVTSRNISSYAGQPPDALSDATALSPFDLVISGSAEALTTRDLAGLEGFMRKRGGAVVMLLDQVAGGEWTRLVDVQGWNTATGSDVVSIEPVTRDSSALRASELAWPTRLPIGATPVAMTASVARDTNPPRAVVWRSAVGAGRVVVSGAMDSWRFREAELAAFEKFWRNLLAETANSAVPLLDLSVAGRLLRPSVPGSLTVIVRDAALSSSLARSVSAAVEATLETPSGTVPVRLWPEGPIGHLHGQFRAPATPGKYKIQVSAEGARAEAVITVADTLAFPHPDERDILTAWVNSRGGKSFSEAQRGEIVSALRSALQPQMQMQTWYPMRSPWWIVPFGLAMGAEWWLRRRRGVR